MVTRIGFEEATIKSNEIEKALNVVQIQYQDAFLMDNWEQDAGLTYLTGAYFIEEISDGSEIHILVRTLDCYSYHSNEYEYITDAFVNKYNRLQAIWDSGLHAKLNPPSFYIDWAISKRIDISWLDDAIEQGFYKPKQLQEVDKPITEKERETLLIIIAALAKEAKVDIAKTSKAGALIENMTQLMGARIGATTAETHLKKIPQALANRAK